MNEDILSSFTVQEFLAMLNGQPDVDVAVMRPTIQYTDGLNKTTQVVEWFWEIMTEATRDERAAVLKFCTGEVEGVWVWRRVIILTQHCYPPRHKPSAVGWL